MKPASLTPIPDTALEPLRGGDGILTVPNLTPIFKPQPDPWVVFKPRPDPWVGTITTLPR